MSTAYHLRFLRRYLSDPHTVGAVAPSSRALAEALCEPFRQRTSPAAILEVGAGTGVFTRQIGTLLGDGDFVDVCEIRPDFADIIEADVLSAPSFAMAKAEGRVRLLRGAVQDIAEDDRYDFIVSGLPLTAFEFQTVKDVFGALRRALKPGGVLSYFEYVGLRRISRSVAMGSRRRRVNRVSTYLSGRIRKHEFARKTVLKNFPPAYARHLRFD